MKRLITLFLITFVTVGGAFATTLSFSTQKLDYVANKSVQIQPSEEIIEVFSDEDNDVDEQFEDIKDFLNIGADINRLTPDDIEYINYIVNNNIDDVRDDIYDELKAAIYQYKVDEVFMVLGNNKIILSRDF